MMPLRSAFFDQTGSGPFSPVSGSRRKRYEAVTLNWLCIQAQPRTKYGQSSLKQTNWYSPLQEPSCGFSHRAIHSWQCGHRTSEISDISDISDIAHS